MSTDLVRREAPAMVLRFANFNEAMVAAKAIGASQLVPQRFRGKPADVLVAWQYGAELGLQPMQSLQSIAVINGTPALYADGLLAVAMSHPDWAGKIETLEDDVARCVIKRKGVPDTESTFSVDDAKRAQLWGKQGPWTQYPQRMLQMRARGFAIRDAFADALRGFKTVEELRDYPERSAAPTPAMMAHERTPHAQPQPQREPTVSDDGEVVQEAEVLGDRSEAFLSMIQAISRARSLDELGNIKPNGEMTADERKEAIAAWRARKLEVEGPTKEKGFGW